MIAATVDAGCFHPDAPRAIGAKGLDSRSTRDCRLSASAPVHVRVKAPVRITGGRVEGAAARKSARKFPATDRVAPNPHPARKPGWAK